MQVFKWLINFYFGSTPARFKSDYDLATSITKLNEAIREQAASSDACRILGEADKMGVHLQRWNPAFQWRSRPIFKGKLTEFEDGCWLVGRFSGNSWLFSCFLIFSQLAFIKLLSQDLLSGELKSWDFYVFPIVIFTLFNVMLWLPKRLYANDLPLVSSFIQSSLSAKSHAAMAAHPIPPASTSAASAEQVLMRNFFAIIVFGDLIGMAYFALHPVFHEWLINLGFGASLLSLPGFVLALLIQAVNDGQPLQRYRSKLRRLAWMSTATSGLAIFMYWFVPATFRASMRLLRGQHE